MKDYFGKELSVDDTVILIAPGYRHFAKGKITSFTPKKVRVTYKNNWNYQNGLDIEIIQDPDQLVRYNI